MLHPMCNISYGRFYTPCYRVKMALVNLTEAAKMVGKTRQTMHRYVKQGKLSVKRDAKGLPQVDTSELIRVFGDIKINVTPQEPENVTPCYTHSNDDKFEALMTEIKALKDQVAELTKLTLRLEHKPSTPDPKKPKNITTRPEDDPEWPQEIKSFADTRLRNEIRARYK